MEATAQTEGSQIERIRETIRAAQRSSFAEVSEDSVIEGLANGHYQAWDFDDCIVITSVIAYGLFSNVRINYISGDLPDELETKILSKLEEFAKSIGCRHVEINGRRGWTRRLKSKGYNEAFTTVLKEIDYE